MTEEEALAFVGRIGESIVNGIDKDDVAMTMEPACHALARELDMDHEYMHRMINTFEAAASAYGCGGATFAFIMGRKWGLMEAQEMLSGGVPDAPE
jgi:hypothetical protein